MLFCDWLKIYILHNNYITNNNYHYSGNEVSVEHLTWLHDTTAPSPTWPDPRPSAEKFVTQGSDLRIF